MSQIRISPDQMHDRATEYRTEAATVNGVITKLDSLLELLKGEWEGAASESYAERFAELRPSFLQAEQLINEIASALDSTANIIAETDSNIAGQFKM